MTDHNKQYIAARDELLAVAARARALWTEVQTDETALVIDDTKIFVIVSSSRAGDEQADRCAKAAYAIRQRLSENPTAADDLCELMNLVLTVEQLEHLAQHVCN